MLSYLAEIRHQLLTQISSGGYLRHLVLLGVAVVAYFLLRPKAKSQPERPNGQEADGSKAAGGKVQGASAQIQDPLLQALPRGINHKGEPWSHEMQDWAHVQGVLHRGESRDFIVSDPPEAYCFENEFCTGRYMPMFRPTADPRKDKPGIYPAHEHFKGRKRLWENRFQFQFKEVPDGDGGLRFGIQLAEYVPLGTVAKRSMAVVVAALRRVVGQDLYHSPGEPSTPGQETELPTFVMPLWAYDQFIVTPAGEEPPDLNDPHFAEFGTHRVGDRKKFIEELSQLKLEVGPTYSFSFWGISQFMDTCKWTICKVLPIAIDFNTFCKRPPVTLCVYSIKPGALTKDDKRHLESRKRYYFRIDFWASKKPPANRQIKELFPQVHVDVAPSDVQQRRSWLSFVACCSGQRE